MNAPDNTRIKAFQLAFGKYLRDPQSGLRPPGIPARRSQVYEELLFSNICGFVDSCFPVCRAILKGEQWRQLCRGFFRDWRCATPYFSNISSEFVHYLNSPQCQMSLPPWLAELAHYEWIELAVDIARVEIPPPREFSSPEDNVILLNPSLKNLSYQWPVQRISAAEPEPAPEQTFLAVYRDRDNTVQFCALNAVTSRLLEIVADAPRTGREALAQLAEEMQHPQPQSLKQFGYQLIQQLAQQAIIV